MDGMLTLREVMDYLDLEQAKVESLVRKGRLSAYKIGGTYLRFKKDQVIALKVSSRAGFAGPGSVLRKAQDYWYFNRIYILSLVLIILIVFLLVR